MSHNFRTYIYIYILNVTVTIGPNHLKFSQGVLSIHMDGMGSQNINLGTNFQFGIIRLHEIKGKT